MSGSARHPRLVLAVLCAAEFLVLLDATVVNIALPSIQADLGLSPEHLQWVMTGYTLLFGGFLLVGGRASDLLGRRRVFVGGVAIFTAASLVGGLAWNTESLVVARGAQGLGAAFLTPAALAMLVSIFEGPARTRALAVWGAIAAAGGAVGLLLGGLVVAVGSWRLMLLINVPVGLAAIVLALRLLPALPGSGRLGEIDVAGAVTLTGGLVALVFAIARLPAAGAEDATTIGAAAIGVGLLAAFAAIERRHPNPIAPPSVLRRRRLAVANTALIFVSAGLFGVFFFASIYVQDVLGYSPLEAGLAFLPVAAAIAIGAAGAERLVARIGIKRTLLSGLGSSVVGLLLLRRTGVESSYAADLLPGLVAVYLGMGLSFVPLTLLATSAVDAEDVGLASGLYNTAEQIGGSLGLVAVVSIAAAYAGADAVPSEIVAGQHAGYLAGVVLLGVSAGVVALLVSAGDEPAEAGGPEPAGVTVAARGEAEPPVPV